MLQGADKINTILGRFRYSLRTHLGRVWWMYKPVFQVTSRFVERSGQRLVTPTTDIVIDGFPRSANTFAWRAFTVAQWDDVTVANHTHAPAQIIGAVRWKIPVIVLVRDPVDAVVSLCLRNPVILPQQGLRAYIRFYRCLWPYRENITIGDFETVTSHYGEIIRRLNEQHGVSFSVFHHTEASEKKCIEWIKQRNRKREAGAQQMLAASAREKQESKEQVREAVMAPELRAIRAQALNIYNAWVDFGNPHRAG